MPLDDPIVLNGFYSMGTKLADRFNSDVRLLSRHSRIGINMHTDTAEAKRVWFAYALPDCKIDCVSLFSRTKGRDYHRNGGKSPPFFSICPENSLKCPILISVVCKKRTARDEHEIHSTHERLVRTHVIHKKSPTFRMRTWGIFIYRLCAVGEGHFTSHSPLAVQPWMVASYMASAWTAGR